MWFDMRRESLSFVEHAPVLRATVAEVAAPRADVFRELLDAPGWTAWFPNVRTAAYTTPPPYGRGAIRVANMAGTRWQEEIIACDVGRRFGWTVTGASVPLANAQVELFELTDAPNGTAIRWTLALELRLVARLGTRFAEPAIRRLWRRATQNLEKMLHDRRGTAGMPG